MLVEQILELRAQLGHDGPAPVEKQSPAEPPDMRCQPCLAASGAEADSTVLLDIIRGRLAAPEPPCPEEPLPSGIKELTADLERRGPDVSREFWRHRGGAQQAAPLVLQYLSKVFRGCPSAAEHGYRAVRHRRLQGSALATEFVSILEDIDALLRFDAAGALVSKEMEALCRAAYAQERVVYGDAPVCQPPRKAHASPPRIRDADLEVRGTMRMQAKFLRLCRLSGAQKGPPCEDLQ